MSAQSVRTSETPAAAPCSGALERAFANEFLLATVETFVPLAVVLAGESFAADRADEGALVGVSSKM